MPLPILPGAVQTAAQGALGFDTDTVINDRTAEDFRNAGFHFCARYLSLSNGQNPYDLTTLEATTILNTGFALTAIQHAYSEGWKPEAALGTLTGTNAAANAQSIGLPAGMNIWCSLSGITPGTPSDAVIDYCQAWYDAVSAAGYIPGLYVGANSILNSDQLSSLLFRCFWRSGYSNISGVPVTGYQLTQTIPAGSSIDGIPYNSDITTKDSSGLTMQWLTLNGSE